MERSWRNLAHQMFEGCGEDRFWRLPGLVAAGLVGLGLEPTCSLRTLSACPLDVAVLDHIKRAGLRAAQLPGNFFVPTLPHLE